MNNTNRVRANNTYKGTEINQLYKLAQNATKSTNIELLFLNGNKLNINKQTISNRFKNLQIKKGGMVTSNRLIKNNKGIWRYSRMGSTMKNQTTHAFRNAKARMTCMRYKDKYQIEKYLTKNPQNIDLLDIAVSMQESTYRNINNNARITANAMARFGMFIVDCTGKASVMFKNGVNLSIKFLQDLKKYNLKGTGSLQKIGKLFTVFKENGINLLNFIKDSEAVKISSERVNAIFSHLRQLGGKAGEIDGQQVIDFGKFAFKHGINGIVFVVKGFGKGAMYAGKGAMYAGKRGYICW